MGFARKNWTIQDLDSYYRITVKFFVDRKELSTESLSALTVRIKMIHCMADIAYTEDFSEKYFKKLEAAGLKVSLDKIEGAPHFGALTHGTQYVSLVSGWSKSSTDASQNKPHSSRLHHEPYLHTIAGSAYHRHISLRRRISQIWIEIKRRGFGLKY